MVTSSRPMPPAISAAADRLRPNSAVTDSDDDRSNASGSAPKFSELARPTASDWAKLPVIWVSVVIAPWMVGATTTWPSSVNATALPTLAVV